MDHIKVMALAEETPSPFPPTLNHFTVPIVLIQILEESLW